MPSILLDGISLNLAQPKLPSSINNPSNKDAINKIYSSKKL